MKDITISEPKDIFHLLHRATSKLQYTKSENEVFDLLAEFLHRIFPDTYLILSRKPEDEDYFNVHKIVGFDGLMGKIIKLFGSDPRDVKLPFDEMPEKNVEQYENRKFVLFEDGLNDLSYRKMNRTILKAVEKLLGIDKVGAMSLCVGKDYFGGVAFLFTKPDYNNEYIDEVGIKIMETYMFQCSILIKQFRDEKELKKSHDELKQSNFELKQHTEFKNQLFSIIAHDLKTPFNSLVGFSEILLTDYHSLTDEQRLEYIQYLNLSSLSAFELLNNLLHWSRIQFNNVVILKEKVNLLDIVKESIDPLAATAKNKKINITVNVDDDIEVLVDKSTLGIVIYNLLMNAVKFSYEKSTVTVYGRKEANQVIIGVQDTGIGMTTELQNSLFKTGNIISNSGTAQEKGTGLGLMICKDFIGRNGGELKVISKVNEGSTFQVILPQ